jgi:hypothetical protein
VSIHATRGALSRGLEQLFDFQGPETRGERIHFKLLELFMLSHAVWWGWQWGAQLRTIAAVVAPQGIARYLDVSFMLEGRAGLVNAALITLCALAAALERWPRVALPLLLSALHLQYVARHCLGKAAHGSQFVGMGLLVLAVATCFMPTPTSVRRFALGGTRFFMGIGYVCAAISKLVTTGRHWADGRHLWLWMSERGVDQLSNTGAHHLNALQRFCFEHPLLATTFLGFGLLTELLGFLLWFRRTRAPITLGLIGLHLGVFATMNLLFDTYIYQLALVGLPVGPLLDALATRRTRSEASS